MNTTSNASADASTQHNVDRIMTERFATGTPRSLQYKLGMRATLEHRLYSVPFADCPFDAGHPAADAYFAGCEEGKSIARRLASQVPA